MPMNNFIGFKLLSVRHRLSDLDLCGLPRPLDLSKARRVMVFAPHPDDETLGCGGTLAQLAAMAEVFVVLVTDGSGAGGLGPGADLIRQQEFLDALGVLGIHQSVCLHQPDGAFEDGPQIRHQIAHHLKSFQPNWVFLPSPLDYHRDHIRISVMMEALCRRQQSIETLLFYEIWAPCPATHVVDITDWSEQKQRALSCHQTALAAGDYLRAVRGLQAYRGLYLGRDREAEAFWVLPNGHRKGLFKTLLHLTLSILRMIRVR